MKSEESTPLFLICIGSYLGFGLIWKFTEIGREWYVIIPIGIFGLLKIMYPWEYVEAKLRKWGMLKDKAEIIAGVFWLSCLMIFLLIFGTFGD